MVARGAACPVRELDVTSTTHDVGRILTTVVC